MNPHNEIYEEQNRLVTQTQKESVSFWVTERALFVILLV